MGNTPNPSIGRIILTGHPHTRGEHTLFKKRNCKKNGPSPHPWGTRCRDPSALTVSRAIPTPVGNTGRQKLRPFPCSGHPHTRGEHLCFQCLVFIQGGPSPHPWGTHNSGARTIDDARAIPTPVGNTTVSMRPASKSKGHPHTRGEHGRWVCVRQ